MKRYLIFAALGPLLGGFILLFVTTYQSGYWTADQLPPKWRSCSWCSPRRCNTAICSACCRR